MAPLHCLDAFDTNCSVECVHDWQHLIKSEIYYAVHLLLLYKDKVSQLQRKAGKGIEHRSSKQPVDTEAHKEEHGRRSEDKCARFVKLEGALSS